MNRWASWAIRITHLPTGTVVETDERGCATRSMYKAKAKLMTMLRSKLAAPSRPAALVRSYDLISDTVTDGWGERRGAQNFLDGCANKPRAKRPTLPHDGRKVFSAAMIARQETRLYRARLQVA